MCRRLSQRRSRRPTRQVFQPTSQLICRQSSRQWNRLSPRPASPHLFPPILPQTRLLACRLSCPHQRRAHRRPCSLHIHPPRIQQRTRRRCRPLTTRLKSRQYTRLTSRRPHRPSHPRRCLQLCHRPPTSRRSHPLTLRLSCRLRCRLRRPARGRRPCQL